MSQSLVLGAHGYLGRHMAHYLRMRGEYVMTCDIAPAPVDASVPYVQADVANAASVASLDFDVDFIYVFSGLTGTEVGFERYRDFVEVNEIGLLNILQHHRASGSRARIVFPSTRLVYKGKQGALLTEDSEKEALTPYAQNKLSCEAFLSMYQRLFGIEFTVFRVCVPYGNEFQGAYSYGTVGFFLQRAMSQQPLELFGDGSLRRTFTHVLDICCQMALALEHPASRNVVLNVGGENLSLMEAATFIAEAAGVEVRTVPWPPRAWALESGDTVFDASRMEALTKPLTTHSYADWVQHLFSER